MTVAPRLCAILPVKQFFAAKRHSAPVLAGEVRIMNEGDS
jgi:hypothetical protein